MSEIRTYSVVGMTCSHCVASVTEEVKEIPEVDGVDVVLETGALTVSSSASVDDASVKAAVEEAGYQLA